MNIALIGYMGSGKSTVADKQNVGLSSDSS